MFADWRQKGREHDSTVIQESTAHKAFLLRGNRTFLLGDAAYDNKYLDSYIVAPFVARVEPLTQTQALFMTIQSGCRQLVESTIGRLKLRFRCLLYPLVCRQVTLERVYSRERMWEAILVVSIFIHNMIQDSKPWRGHRIASEDLEWPSFLEHHWSDVQDMAARGNVSAGSNADRSEFESGSTSSGRQRGGARAVMSSAERNSERLQYACLREGEAHLESLLPRIQDDPDSKDDEEPELASASEQGATDPESDNVASSSESKVSCDRDTLIPDLRWYKHPRLEPPAPGSLSVTAFSKRAAPGCPLFDPRLMAKFEGILDDHPDGSEQGYTHQARYYRDRICFALASALEDEVELRRLEKLREKYLRKDIDNGFVRSGLAAEAVYGESLSNILRRPGIAVRRLSPDSCLRWPPLVVKGDRACAVCERLEVGKTCPRHQKYVEFYEAFRRTGDGVIPVRESSLVAVRRPAG